MYDLIDESGKDLQVYGYSVKKLSRGNATLSYLNVDSEEKAEKLDFAQGEYFVLNTPLIHEREEDLGYFIQILTNCLKRFFKSKNISKSSKILIVGLGNSDILADCLGKATLDNLNSGRKNVYKICPGIYPMTGIDTVDFVKYISNGVKADAIIAIDALATNEITRLATSIQLTTVGIAPGSGVKSDNKKICEEEIGKPCISIGVPLMMFASSLNRNAPSGLLLTTKDIHENVFSLAYILGNAINKVLN